MSTLEQLRQGLGRALQSLSDGWQHLMDRAAHALTVFQPPAPAADVETVEDRVIRHASRWGLIAAEMQETDDEVIVRLEAPGMTREDFDISVIDDVLVVRGEKQLQREDHRGYYHMMECAYGQFERAMPLPVSVSKNKANAGYRAGVLTIHLPKAASAKRRRIPITSA
jgi:HSP20 family protein